MSNLQCYLTIFYSTDVIVNYKNGLQLMTQIHVFFSGLCWQYVCYYRMSNLDERRNSTKSITQKIMLCFPQVSQCTELDLLGRAFCVVLVCVCCITSSFLNASNASLVPRRRS